MARQTTKRAEWARWLAAQGHDLAGLTGTDTHVLAAIAACWNLAAYVGLERVWPFVHVALFPLLQAKYRGLAIDLVAQSMDWSDARELAARLDPDANTPALTYSVREASDIVARMVTLPQRGRCGWCVGSGHASTHEKDCPLFLGWVHQARASLGTTPPLVLDEEDKS